MMVTNMKDYLMLDENDDDADFRCNYRDTMIAQFKQDLYNKSFSHQDQNNCEGGLRKRFKLWLSCFANMGGPKPDNIYDFEYNDEGLNYFFEGQSMIQSLEN